MLSWGKHRNQEEKSRKKEIFLCDFFRGHLTAYVLSFGIMTAGGEVRCRETCNNTVRIIRQGMKVWEAIGVAAV